jgi:hypothetical protein
MEWRSAKNINLWGRKYQIISWCYHFMSMTWKEEVNTYRDWNTSACQAPIEQNEEYIICGFSIVVFVLRKVYLDFAQKINLHKEHTSIIMCTILLWNLKNFSNYIDWQNLLVTEASPLSSIADADCARALRIARFGVPTIITSDRERGSVYVGIMGSPLTSMG